MEEEMTREKGSVAYDKRAKAYEFFSTPQKDRTMSNLEFRKSLHLGGQTIQRLRLEWHEEMSRSKVSDYKADKLRAIMEKTLGTRPDVEVTIAHRPTPQNKFKDPTDEEMKAEVVRGLFAEAKSGNHQAAFRLSQIKGWIIDKQEIIIGQLTADDYARRNIEADRQLEERGHRVAEVPEKPALLLGEVCEGAGQAARDNSLRDAPAYRESADRPADISA